MNLIQIINKWCSNQTMLHKTSIYITEAYEMFAVQIDYRDSVVEYISFKIWRIFMIISMYPGEGESLF